MNHSRFDDIFDEAVECLKRGEEPEIAAGRWPEYAHELRKLLGTSRELLACAEDYDDLGNSVAREVDWTRLLGQVPQEEAYSANVPPVCPAVRQIVMANVLSGTAHEGPPAVGLHKRQQPR